MDKVKLITQSQEQHPALTKPTDKQQLSDKENTSSDDRKEYAWFVVAGAIYLTINCSIAVARSIGRGDYRAFAFVISAYADLLLLFVCLRLFEKTPEENTQRRNILRVVIWCSMSVLILMFCHSASLGQPFMVLNVLIWIIGASTIVAGFYVLVVHKPMDCSSSDGKMTISAADEQV